MIKLEETERGFLKGDFEDRYGHSCSIQESSLATEDCIWLGINDADPQILVPGHGWSPYSIPEDVLLTTRMHLDRENVEELVKTMQYWLDNGELPSDDN